MIAFVHYSMPKVFSFFVVIIHAVLHKKTLSLSEAPLCVVFSNNNINNINNIK